jgi:hypothetical protein
MRIGEALKVGAGYVTRALPLHKWPRKDGPASFLSDLIALRKSVLLCYSCEQKMGRRWQDRINYGLVKSFHADDGFCDSCRHSTSCNLYIPVEGQYYQDMTFAETCIKQTKERERQTAQRDRVMLYTY